MCRTTLLRLARGVAQTLLLILVSVVAAPHAAAATRPSRTAVELTGRVIDQTGRPAAGVRISVTAEDSSDDGADPAERPPAEATTDGDGRFSLRIESPQDSYRFHLEGDGYTSFDTAAALTAGGGAELEFTILDEATGRRSAAATAYNAAVEALKQQDLVAARGGFVKALELDQSMVEAHLGIARVDVLEGRLVEAQESVDRFLASRADDPAGLALALALAQELGDGERAERLVDTLLGLGGDGVPPELVYNLGVEAMQQGDLEQAVVRFRQAADLDPELVAAHTGLAVVTSNLGRYAESSAALDRLLTLDPGNVRGLRTRYLVETAAGSSDRAAAALEAYLTADPDGAVELMLEQADQRFQNGDSAGAAGLLERVLALRPDKARAHYSLGLCLLQSDSAKARGHLERFLVLAPDDPDAATVREILAYQ